MKIDTRIKDISSENNPAIHPYRIICSVRDIEPHEIISWCFDTIGKSMCKLTLKMLRDHPEFEHQMTTPNESTWVSRHAWNKLHKQGYTQEFFFKNYTDALMFKMRWCETD